MSSLSLVSVNIEQSKHLDRVTNFLAGRMPEVVCIQELFESDIDRISQSLGGAQAVFLPMMHRADSQGAIEVMGLGIFSRLTLASSDLSYYQGTGADLGPYDETDIDSRNRTKSLGLLTCDVEKEGTKYRIATTHFTWTPRGGADDYQRRDLTALLALLATKGELVLTGDFNAPRIHEGEPGEIFTQIAALYKDNIPPQYLTSLDLDLHRAGKTVPHEIADKMVDGLFTTPGYSATDVVLHTGVSDHCAVTATISHSA